MKPPPITHHMCGQTNDWTIIIAVRKKWVCRFITLLVAFLSQSPGGKEEFLVITELSNTKH